MSLTLALLCLSLVAAAVVDEPYCSLRHRRLCQGKGQHIACLFPYARRAMRRAVSKWWHDAAQAGASYSREVGNQPGPGDSCENYTENIFSKDTQNYITHFINRKRQRLAAGYEKVRGGMKVPKPAVMMQVEWDRELATLAQRLADQCSFVHDGCRATVRYPYPGQTVGEVKWRRSSESDELVAQRSVRRIMDAWWGERRRVMPQQLTAPFKIDPKGTTWGHFSQLAVWSLRAVGCGAVIHGVIQPKLLLVCDYSHTNMLGQPTLRPGPVVPCPTHTVRRPRSPYPLLCAPARHHRIQDSYDPKDQYEEYDDMADAEPPTTKSATRHVTVTAKTKTIKTELSRTNSKIEPELEAQLVSTTAAEFTDVKEVTGRTKYELDAKVDDNVVLKDKQFDPLVHREGKQSYKVSTRGRFVNRLQQELEGRYSHQAERYHGNHLWQNPLSSYAYFRENQERLAEKHDRKNNLKFPKRGRQEDERSYEEKDQGKGFYNTKKEEIETHIKSDYDPPVQIKEHVIPSAQSEEVYSNSEQMKEHAGPLVERKQASITNPQHRKGIYAFPIQKISRRKYLYESIFGIQTRRPLEYSYRPILGLRQEPASKNIYADEAKKIYYEPSMPRKIQSRYEKINEYPQQKKDIYEPVKHKSKHIRKLKRPIRPTALAQHLNRPLERESLVGQKMDGDDVDQLIKDTGFNPYLKQTKS